MALFGIQSFQQLLPPLHGSAKVFASAPADPIVLQPDGTFPADRLELLEQREDVVSARIMRSYEGIPSRSPNICTIDRDHEKVGGCFLKALVEFLSVDLEEVAEIEGDAQISAIGSLCRPGAGLRPTGQGCRSR